MDFNQIKTYWDDRAASDSSAQSTTQDFYLREIEFRVLKTLIDRYKPISVTDLGCGDARTTAQLATAFPGVRFMGGDYSQTMVTNARTVISQARIDNLGVTLCDVTKPFPQMTAQML